VSLRAIRSRSLSPSGRWSLGGQHRHPSETEAQGWFYEWPEAGIGIVTGAISGLVVIDIDLRQGGDVALNQLEHERFPA
jgi:hypothetical protein